MANPSTLISFRPFLCADIPLFFDWILRPHVALWWEDCPSVDEVENWCLPATDVRQERHEIAMLDANPVGFIQTYAPILGHEDGWWLAERDPGVRGIDLFLANADQLGQGLGTRLLRALTARLFDDPSVSRIQCDPAPNNYRAIRCYEKAGFHTMGEITTPDGPAMLMYCERSSNE